MLWKKTAQAKTLVTRNDNKKNCCDLFGGDFGILIRLNADVGDDNDDDDESTDGGRWGWW